MNSDKEGANTNVESQIILVFAERTLLNKTPKGHFSSIRKQIYSHNQKRKKINIEPACVAVTRNPHNREQETD